MACRVPFQHDADSCDCRPSRLDIQIDRFAASAELRKLSDSLAKDFLLLAIVGLAAFFACFGGAAIVDQGRDNLKTWVAANEPV